MAIDVCGTGKLITLEAALQRILADIQPLDRQERVPLKEALGRVLAADVAAPLSLPQFANAAMDGYALRAGDVPALGEATLPVIGTSWAGRPYGGEIGLGQCLRIFTGALMPENADAVVMQEHVTLEDGCIRVAGPMRPGQNVRQAGEELVAGSMALAAASRIGSAELALLAALGIAEVPVAARTRVAYLSTGDELQTVGQSLGPGQIYDSNRYALDALIREAGAEPLDQGVIVDDPPSLKQALQQAAASADVVLTSGGVSVGEADFVKDVLDEIGEVRLWKLALKPGKPLAFGRIGHAWFFGLPGNPVAVLVAFRQLVAPALAKLAGQTLRPPLRFPARCRRAIKKAAGRLEFQRGRLERDTTGQWWATPFSAQGSHLLTGMTRADCLILLPVECAGVAEGDTVEVEPLTCW